MLAGYYGHRRVVCACGWFILCVCHIVAVVSVCAVCVVYENRFDFRLKMCYNVV